MREACDLLTTTNGCRDELISEVYGPSTKDDLCSSILQKETNMRLDDFDNLQRHQPQGKFHRPTESLSPLRWIGRLSQNPFAIVLLVWGLLFLILSVSLSYTQDACHDVNQQRFTVGVDRGDCDQMYKAANSVKEAHDSESQPPATSTSRPDHKTAFRRLLRRQ